MLFLCSPMEKSLLISLLLLLVCVVLSLCRFCIKYMKDENNIE